MISVVATSIMIYHATFFFIACISMLARAVRQGIKHDVSAMLDSMLSAGLSPALTTALYKLALYIPAFKKEIGESYEGFDRKRALEKYQFQSEVIKVML